MKIMRRSAVAAVVLGVFVAAGAALADHHTIKVSTKEGIGKYLADARGMTLYVFRKDSPGVSACEGPCVEKWPPFYQEAVMAGGDLKAGEFGAITRGDGKKQTTYKGMPLYYFAGDKNPGETNGQGVRDIWYAAAP